MLNVDLLSKARPGTEFDGEYTVGADFWESIPAFSYEAPGLDWAIRHQAAALFMLATWLVGLYVVTRWAVLNKEMVA